MSAEGPDLDMNDIMASLRQALGSDDYRQVEQAAQGHYAQQAIDTSAKVQVYGSRVTTNAPEAPRPRLAISC